MTHRNGWLTGIDDWQEWMTDRNGTDRNGWETGMDERQEWMRQEWMTYRNRWLTGMDDWQEWNWQEWMRDRNGWETGMDERQEWMTDRNGWPTGMAHETKQIKTHRGSDKLCLDGFMYVRKRMYDRIGWQYYHQIYSLRSANIETTRSNRRGLTIFDLILWIWSNPQYNGTLHSTGVVTMEESVYINKWNSCVVVYPLS